MSSEIDLIEIVDDLFEFVDEHLERRPMVFVAMPALVHDGVDLIGTGRRLLEPMAILKFDQQHGDVDALVRSAAVRSRLPARHAVAPHVRFLVELARRCRIWRIPSNTQVFIYFAVTLNYRKFCYIKVSRSVELS